MVGFEVWSDSDGVLDVYAAASTQDASQSRVSATTIIHLNEGEKVTVTLSKGTEELFSHYKFNHNSFSGFLIASDRCKDLGTGSLYGWETVESIY